MVDSAFNSVLREEVNKHYREDEEAIVAHLLKEAKLSAEKLAHIRLNATKLIETVRQEEKRKSGIDSFMNEYDLSSDEGIALMCLAEAMLRIPDKITIDKLIREKIGTANWKDQLGKSDSWTINAATWALMLTGKVLNQDRVEKKYTGVLRQFFQRTGEPVIRKAVEQAMRIMSKQFVMGRTMDEALSRARVNEALGFRYSYDMLGEAARTQEDANVYFQSYQDAISAISLAAKGCSLDDSPGVSVKLSALHPRYDYSQRARVIDEITPKVLKLAQMACEGNIGLTIDAEEADRLDLSLDVIEQVFRDPSLKDWEGLGLALQSYQKRAWYLLDWLADLAKSEGRRIKVRLIKGAYWDTEIKISQMQGFKDYPVFTRKASTDASFIACAKKLVSYHEHLYPQFATHNAYSVAVVMELMDGTSDYEFQCLHGMGQSLYNEIVKKENIPCRIYAPVGSHEDLLPYLVRRLLENGANTSFVNRISDAEADIEELIEDPVVAVSSLAKKRHSLIPVPANIFGVKRLNASGIDLSDRDILARVEAAVLLHRKTNNSTENSKTVHSPIDNAIHVGNYRETDVCDIDSLIMKALDGFNAWDKITYDARAACLNAVADLYEAHTQDFINLLVNEAGKTLGDAVSEIREAVDFCRYYASTAVDDLAIPTEFEGYTGEINQLYYGGRGVMVCISPWNFPLAIFTGQVVAALVCGNAVMAKPAEQTPLVAQLAVELMHEAGIPKQVLQLVIGSGETVGDALVSHEKIAGVIFTGSTHTAQLINKRLANKSGPIIPFIAETGGVNAMIADSSALAEQLVQDVLQSAFGSAGQRCSALRVLFIQEEAADKFINMLSGALSELRVGDPVFLETDLGPVIDNEALDMIKHHIDALSGSAKLIAKGRAYNSLNGTFVEPHAFELAFEAPMPVEVFGPVLHVYRFRSDALSDVIDKINSTGYGLTLGIHSRINETVDYILQRVHAGNQYVNRDMIGAVVGLQPFGGEGLSGTGPKAGGPNYLKRLSIERTVTTNTTAAGGNASLMSLNEN